MRAVLYTLEGVSTKFSMDRRSEQLQVQRTGQPLCDTPDGGDTPDGVLA